ncbi:MAG: hypothetical protein ACK5LT_08955 [Lachnospirales bacterium]
MEDKNDIPNGSALLTGVFIGAVHLIFTYRNDAFFNGVFVKGCIIIAIILGVFMGMKVYKIKDKKIRLRIACAEFIFVSLIIFMSSTLTAVIGSIYTLIILVTVGALYVKYSPKYLNRDFI